MVQRRKGFRLHRGRWWRRGRVRALQRNRIEWLPLARRGTARGVRYEPRPQGSPSGQGPRLVRCGSPSERSVGHLADASFASYVKFYLSRPCCVPALELDKTLIEG